MKHDNKPPTAGETVTTVKKSFSQIENMSFVDIQKEIQTLQLQNKRLKAQISTRKAEEFEKKGENPRLRISEENVLALVQKMYNNPIRSFDLTQKSLSEMAAWRKLYQERYLHAKLLLELKNYPQKTAPSFLQKWTQKGLRLLEEHIRF